MAEERTKKEEVETSGKNLEMEFNKDEKLMVDEIEPKEPTDQEKLEIKERAAAAKAEKDAEVAAAAN